MNSPNGGGPVSPPAPVLATTMTRSDWMPLVMKVLAPFSIQSSPSGRAVLVMPCRSLPADGSVIAIAPISSPAHSPGSHRRCWDSVPSRSR